MNDHPFLKETFTQILKKMSVLILLTRDNRISSSKKTLSFNVYNFRRENSSQMTESGRRVILGV